MLHDIAALVMLVGFIVHIYEGTAAQPGTFRVDDARHGREAVGVDASPAWYRRATGRDPRADYEQARQRATNRSS